MKNAIIYSIIITSTLGCKMKASDSALKESGGIVISFKQEQETYSRTAPWVIKYNDAYFTRRFRAPPGEFPLQQFDSYGNLTYGEAPIGLTPAQIEDFISRQVVKSSADFPKIGTKGIFVPGSTIPDSRPPEYLKYDGKLLKRGEFGTANQFGVKDSNIKNEEKGFAYLPPLEGAAVPDDNSKSGQNWQFYLDTWKSVSYYFEFEQYPQELRHLEN